MGSIKRAIRGAALSEHDFSLNEAQWEEAVFRHATIFTCTQFRGEGQHERWEFGSFPEALAKAQEPHAGRGRLVYAVAPSGRRICCDRPNWPKWLAISEGREVPPELPPKKVAKSKERELFRALDSVRWAIKGWAFISKSQLPTLLKNGERAVEALHPDLIPEAEKLLRPLREALAK